MPDHFLRIYIFSRKMDLGFRVEKIQGIEKYWKNKDIVIFFMGFGDSNKIIASLIFKVQSTIY